MAHIIWFVRYVGRDLRAVTKGMLWGKLPPRPVVSILSESESARLTRSRPLRRAFSDGNLGRNRSPGAALGAGKRSSCLSSRLQTLAICSPAAVKRIDRCFQCELWTFGSLDHSGPERNCSSAFLRSDDGERGPILLNSPASALRANEFAFLVLGERQHL